MITAAQLRAARALAGMDQKTLAEKAGVSLPTIQRMEASTGNVRGVVSLKRLPSVRTPGGGLRVEVFDQDRPVFAHLKLRTAS